MTVKMQESPSQQIQAMLGLLAGQCELYRQLKTLSQAQSQSVREGSTEQLLAVLSQRQSVIESLSKANTELAPYRDRWDELSGSATPDQRRQVRAAMDEIEQVLGEVVAQDEQDRESLKRVQQQIGAQLKQVGKAGQAIRAYGPPTNQPKAPVFTDRQG